MACSCREVAGYSCGEHCVRVVAGDDALRAENARLLAERGHCTCGSGLHHRECAAHPDRYALQAAELRAEMAESSLVEVEAENARLRDVLTLIAEGEKVPDPDCDWPIYDPVYWAKRALAESVRDGGREGGNP